MLYLFHSILLGLLLTLCHSVRHAAARSLTVQRSTDITCGGEFPRAGDGFAQRPDGCSSLGDNPAQVRDKWGSANFGGVCDQHDRCYYTLDSNMEVCNDVFCGGLARACRKAYCKKVLGATICEPVTHTACTTIAEGYCKAVKIFAPGIYDRAQKLQKRYEACMTEHGGLAPLEPPPAPVLCSNGQPEGATWMENKDGSRCTTTYYACQGGKIVVTRSYHTPHCIEP